MALWIVFAAMTAAAMLAVGWPFVRRPTMRAADTGGDLAVYRDQIAEIARDLEAGMIGPAEADAARVEVSRRLLAAADIGQKQAALEQHITPRLRPLAAACSLLILPVGAVSLYLALGSPDLPAEPLAARIAKAHGGDQSVGALLAKVEAHLEKHADDGRGWEVIAPVYMRLGRYDDAARARTNALRLLGPTAERQANLGEALVAAGNGIVTADAKEAFDAAVRLDPTNVTARFYQGLAAEQDGDQAQAARIWHAMLDAAPPGAEWTGFVREALARVEGPAGTAPAADDAGRDQMIRAMVERLAARLHQDGSDVDGWVRLARSYKVLGDKEQMTKAVADARAAIANDPDKTRRLEEGLGDLEAGSMAEAKEDAPLPASAAAPGIDPMIQGMVDRLDARLHRDGSDVEGWIQLVRSYKVLGQSDRMHAAIADARRALADDPEKLRRLDEGVKSLGVEG